MGKVRVSIQDSEQKDLMSIQRVQNKLVRFLNNAKLKDNVHANYLLNQLNMLSVNQMNAQIKLMEVWKTLNLNQSPLNFRTPMFNPEVRSSRSVSSNKLPETSGSSKKQKTKSSLMSDGKKLWNSAPSPIPLYTSTYSAKKEINKFVKTLPV